MHWIISSAEGGAASDLAGAAAQFLFDATALGAALLISIAAFVVMRLYLRAIFREGQRRAPQPHAVPGMEHGREPSPLSAISPLEIQIEKPGRPSRFRHFTR